MNAETFTEEKTTTVHNLGDDCFLSILAFGHPLDIWKQRLTCSYWHYVVPVALSRVIQVDDSWLESTREDIETIFTDYKEASDCHEVFTSNFIRRVVDLCPNLKIMQIYSSDSSRGKMVTKFDIHFSKKNNNDWFVFNGTSFSFFVNIFPVVVCLLSIWTFKDLKYILDHCTKLSEIKHGALDANLLTNISPHLAFKGRLMICEEVSLEQLKAKLPNLNNVYIRCKVTATEYVTRFCTNFPLLNMLFFDPVESSDALVTAISSLQNLRTLALPDCDFTEDQVCTIIKSLSNLEDIDLILGMPPQHQSFLCVAKMPRLRKLTLNLEYAYKNLHLLTNVNNFPNLRYLKVDAEYEWVDIDNFELWSAEVQTQLENHRPALKVVVDIY